MKHVLLIAGILILFSDNLSAQEIEVTHEKITYKKINGQELTADIFYIPAVRQKKGNPAIGLFHGGGWVFGSPEEFYTTCERYARKGFITFSFQYRLSINEDGSYPNPEITPIESVKDARSAIRWLRENAGPLGISPDLIVVGGQSAGGQLALSTALMDNINEATDNPKTSPVPNALLLFSSCVNTMEAWIDNLLGDRRNQIWAISPFHNLKPGMPPAIAFHGESDCQVLFYTMLFFNDKMKELGNPFELITFPGRDHYLGGARDGKYAGYFDEEILDRTDDFLRKYNFME
jgi:acetyl esterase/lipase